MLKCDKLYVDPSFCTKILHDSDQTFFVTQLHHKELHEKTATRGLRFQAILAGLPMHAIPHGDRSAALRRSKRRYQMKVMSHGLHQRCWTWTFLVELENSYVRASGLKTHGEKKLFKKSSILIGNSVQFFLG